MPPSPSPYPSSRAWGEGSALPLVVEVAGASMRPTLEPGERVRVEPPSAAEPIMPGEIVLLRSEGGLVVHRLVTRFGRGARERLIHRGDAGGRLGVTTPETVAGRVVAIVAPAGRALATNLAELDATLRVRFLRAQRRARCFGIIWSLLGSGGGLLPAAWRARWRAWLLG